MEEMNFEEMRNQFAILKEQLKKQEIVSDHLLRETMKSKRSSINTTKRMCYACVVISLFLTPLNFYTHSWSLAFSIATCLLMLFCAVATYYIHKPVDELNFMRDDFTTVARVMAKFKRQYDFWMHYVTPALLIPWFGWACYDFGWRHAPEGVSPIWMCIPLFVGLLVGLAVGLYYHFKAVNAAQDIIDQIEEK